MTVGNKADWEKLSFEEKQEVGEALERYVAVDFNERHDNMTIYNAIVHLDESGALMLILMWFRRQLDIKWACSPAVL